jgi:hypothetical protein
MWTLPHSRLDSNKCCIVIFTQNDVSTSVSILHSQMIVNVYEAGNHEVLAICWLQAGDYPVNALYVLFMTQQNTDKKSVCIKVQIT